MELDDETTAVQLHSLLSKKGYSISLPTILRCRSSLGWTFRGSAYCQLICKANKVKRFEWCQANIGDDFENIIFTDECSVQLETHRRFSCQRKGERLKPKLFSQKKLYLVTYIIYFFRPKHPLKVHVCTCTCNLCYNYTHVLYMYTLQALLGDLHRQLSTVRVHVHVQLNLTYLAVWDSRLPRTLNLLILSLKKYFAHD